MVFTTKIVSMQILVIFLNGLTAKNIKTFGVNVLMEEQR